MGILNKDHDTINFDNNFDKYDPDAIIHVRLLAWHIKFEKHKALKKELNEELIPVMWDPKRWQNFCVSEDEKKEIESTFTEGL